MSLFELLKQVVTSWQVIAITLAVLVYFFLVLHLAKSYHKPRAKKAKIIKKKEVPAAAQGPEIVDDSMSGDDSNEDLGLEEA